MDVGALASRLELIRVGELVDCDLVLVRVPGPGAVHQAVRLILLVLLQHLDGAGVELGILAAGIERGHAADRQHAALVAHRGHDFAHRLEEGDVVRDGVPVGQHPRRFVQREVDQAGHVIPAAEVEPHHVLAQVVGELFHLVGERM